MSASCHATWAPFRFERPLLELSLLELSLLELSLLELSLWELSLWELSLWELSLWELSLWELSLWERRPRRDTHFARWPSRHDRGEAAAPTGRRSRRAGADCGEGGAGVSASIARRPQSRLAMQGQPWNAAPTGVGAGRCEVAAPAVAGSGTIRAGLA